MGTVRFVRGVKSSLKCNMKLELRYRCHLSFRQAARSGFKVRTTRPAAERPVRSLNLYRKAGSAAHVARGGRKLTQARAKNFNSRLLSHYLQVTTFCTANNHGY